MSSYRKYLIKELDYLYIDNENFHRKLVKRYIRAIKRSEKNKNRQEIEALICEMENDV